MTSVDELFTLSIAAEKLNREFYLTLAGRFSHQPEISGFWRQYAQEETGHMRWLENRRAALDAQQLAAPAAEDIVAAARRVLRFPLQDSLAGVHTLEDACQLADELEHAETNVVFTFLIENFATDLPAMSFLRQQLRQHIAKVDELRQKYPDLGQRAQIRARQD